MITADGRLIALDATNGEIVWDIPVIDPATGNRSDLEMIRDAQSLTPEAIAEYTRFAGNMAPVVFDRKVFVGVSGAGYTAVMDEADAHAIGETIARLIENPRAPEEDVAFHDLYWSEQRLLKWPD